MASSSAASTACGFAAGAFTNISRDHLDYHPSFEDYFEQKLRLFSELLPAGAAAVVDVDSEAGRARGGGCGGARALRLISVGRTGETLRLDLRRADGFASALVVEHGGKRHAVRLPLVGAFQASNALVAAGLCMATGCERRDGAAAARRRCKARAAGSISPARPRAGAPIFIDYAHTPDALAKALDALRPYVENRLVVVFGCGGDRDKGKRPEMGAVAIAKADLAIVTDDNPRSEEPEQPSAARSWPRRPALSRSVTARRRSPRPSAGSSAAMFYCGRQGSRDRADRQRHR